MVVVIHTVRLADLVADGMVRRVMVVGVRSERRHEGRAENKQADEA